MRKAQVFTIDFMISITIFIIVLLTVISTWYYIDTHIKEVESRREMHSISLSISDSLVRSTGHPQNWNSTNVQSIGLAKEEYVLDLRKVMSLLSMDYDSGRTVMRLGNYHVFIYLTDINTYNVSTGVLRSPIAYFCNQQRTLGGNLDSTGMVWDVYQASGPDESALYGERNYYLWSTFGATTSPEKMFNITALNLSQYKTLVLENPDVRNSSINLTAVNEFLDNGGVVLVVRGQSQIGKNVVDQDFLMHSESPGALLSGVINTLDLTLVNSTVGDTVTFGSSLWEYYQIDGDSQLTNIVSDSMDPAKCLICSWNYGRGRIYFVADFTGTVNGAEPLSNRLNFIGRQAKFGIPPTTTTDVIAINRVAVLEGIFRQPVAVHILIWR